MDARIWNHSQWIQCTDKDALVTVFTKMLKESGFKILDYVEHVFQPQGFTALWLLGESHFAIHTFPECEKTYIEISSCNLKYFEKFINLTKDIK